MKQAENAGGGGGAGYLCSIFEVSNTDISKNRGTRWLHHIRGSGFDYDAISVFNTRYGLHWWWWRWWF